nr:MAG TPA: hypothetical protein [Bacteriophage sp.]
MSLVGWVTTHTRVPALYAVGSGRLTADHALLGEARPRLIANVAGSTLVSDPGAPMGVEVTYRFGGQSVKLTRPGASVAGGPVYHQVVTSVDGETVAEVGLLWGDPRSYETGATVHTSALGAHVPRYTLGVPPGEGSLQLVTRGEGTETLRALVGARAPLWVIHNTAVCVPAGCDVEGSRLIVPLMMSEELSERRDVYTRVWQVSYVRVPDALGTSVAVRPSGGPVVTWGQWSQWGKKNSPSGWQAWSAVEVAQRVAGMPSV